MCLWRLGNDDAFDELDGRDDAEPDEPTWRSRVHRDAATCLAADATGDGCSSRGRGRRVRSIASASRGATTTTTSPAVESPGPKPTS